ncbi:MAG: hypothetical protein R3F55_20065 [Alphaproteobacteria bacterium]
MAAAIRRSISGGRIAMRRIFLAGAMALGVCGAAAADDYDAVRSALDAGDYDTAFSALAAMAEAGDTFAATALANLLLSEAAGPPEAGVAIAWLEQAAADGSVNAMLELGALYQRSGPLLFPDRAEMPMAAGYPEALDWFGRAADAGSAIALGKIGGLYRLGVYSRAFGLVTADDELRLSREFLERAAAAGNPAAMSMLAQMVRRDDGARFAALIREAAALGDPLAVGMLAAKPEFGEITDPIDALTWKFAARTAWAYAPNPRSPLLIIAGADTGQDFVALLDEAIAAADPADAAVAEARAAEITAGWVSYMPGQVGAAADDSDSGSGGGLFGRN